MQAVAVFPLERSLRSIDHPEPSISSASEVLVRVLDVGIGEADRDLARAAYGAPPPGSDHLILGHESLAEVTSIGEAVEGVEVGDLVVPRVRRPCDDDRCPACSIHRPDFCSTGRYVERGLRGRHGYMTQRVVEDARYLHVLPPQLAEVGVLLEPLSVAQKALIELSALRRRLPWPPGSRARAPDQALVLGAGAVGLLGALSLSSQGFSVCVYSREEPRGARARWVRSVGARYVGASDCSLAELAAQLPNVDLIYEATGDPHLPFQAMRALGRNATIVLTRVPHEHAPVGVDAAVLVRDLVLKNQLVLGTENAGPDAFTCAVAEMARFEHRWPGALAQMIRRVPLGGACDALCEPSSDIKTVVGVARPKP